MRRFCITADARSLSRRTSRYTLLAYLVRNVASSTAESPPPTTASGLRRKMGTAPVRPSQTEARHLTCVSRAAVDEGPSRPAAVGRTVADGARRDAVLPVLVLAGDVHPLGCGARRDNERLGQDRLLVLLALGPDLERPRRQVHLRDGLAVGRRRGTPSAAARQHGAGGGPRAVVLWTHVRMSVPKRSDCCRMRPMMSWPLMPSGKAGKFSMSVVVVSWPPGTAPGRRGPSQALAESAARHAQGTVVARGPHLRRCHQRGSPQRGAGSCWHGRRRWPPCGHCMPRRQKEQKAGWRAGRRVSSTALVRRTRQPAPPRHYLGPLPIMTTWRTALRSTSTLSLPRTAWALSWAASAMAKAGRVRWAAAAAAAAALKRENSKETFWRQKKRENEFAPKQI